MARRRPEVISQEDLLHWVDIMLDIIEENTTSELYVNCVQVMEHLVQTELDHNNDAFGGN